MHACKQVTLQNYHTRGKHITTKITIHINFIYHADVKLSTTIQTTQHY